MSNSPVNFTQTAASNIVRAARQVLGESTDNTLAASRKHTFYAANFWAEITGHTGSASPFHYAWTEVNEAGSNTQALKTGGRFGTTTTHFAINEYETTATATPIASGTFVMIWLSFDATNHMVFRFSYLNPSVGYYCPEYSTAQFLAADRPIVHTSYNKDAFILTNPGGDITRAMVDWNGLSVEHKKYSAAADKVCHAKILDFTDIGSTGPANIEPVNGGAIGGTTDTKVVNQVVPATIANDQYSVYFKIASETIADDCAICTSPTTKASALISANIYIPSCQYLMNVSDCLSGTSGHNWTCVQNVNFGSGLVVSGSSGSGGTAGSVNVSLGLTVTPTDGVSYTSDDTIGGPGGCGMTLKICTRTITPVATTVITGCDADGNPTTATIYSLPNGDPIIALVACS